MKSASPWPFMLKWDIVRLTQYDVIFFTDTDALLQLTHSNQAAAAEHAWTVQYDAFLRSPAQLVGGPDHNSPINAGVMLLKPSERVYREGLAAMRRGWDADTGWEHAGLPIDIIPPDYKRVFASTNPLRANHWGAQDHGEYEQGLFTYMYLVHERAFVKAKFSNYTMTHYYGSFKPWRTSRCARFFESAVVIRGVDGRFAADRIPLHLERSSCRTPAHATIL
ncbi:hypothetical protein T492DRAFT_966542 [Pavlovales sp. CCMP2436]|nr:hypothetical protein T492DRAFT_966542 [Pavlovales sp. CCMP2436]|mmetsp:Transcript_41673/g.97853  ORF Transcript_41673/g.97853 Transcript_41673/m.97853 type:complete len:222 (+) Transcript_41673:503-1168(+)